MDDLAELLEGAGLSHLVKIPLPEFIREHKRLIRLLGKRKEKAFQKEAADQSEELAKMTGASKASGFVARAMAENYLKHQGQYKNPTSPLHPGSTMNKPLAFDYRRLANAGQGGENAKDYGASPFIQKHFGQAEPVPFVRTRGIPPPLVPRPNKRRVPRSVEVPEGMVASEQVGPVPQLGATEVPRRAPPPPVEPVAPESELTLPPATFPGPPSEVLTEFIDAIRTGKMSGSTFMIHSGMRMTDYRDVFREITPEATGGGDPPKMFDRGKFCVPDACREFSRKKEGSQWRVNFICAVIGGGISPQMLTGAVNYYTDRTGDNAPELLLVPKPNRDINPYAAYEWMETVWTSPSENAREIIDQRKSMGRKIPPEVEEYLSLNKTILDSLRKNLIEIAGIKKPLRYMLTPQTFLGQEHIELPKDQFDKLMGKMKMLEYQVMRLIAPLVGPVGEAPRPGGAAAEPAGASAKQKAATADVFGEAPVERALLPSPKPSPNVRPGSDSALPSPLGTPSAGRPVSQMTDASMDSRFRKALHIADFYNIPATVRPTKATNEELRKFDKWMTEWMKTPEGKAALRAKTEERRARIRAEEEGAAPAAGGIPLEEFLRGRDPTKFYPTNAKQAISLFTIRKGRAPEKWEADSLRLFFAHPDYSLTDIASIVRPTDASGNTRVNEVLGQINSVGDFLSSKLRIKKGERVLDYKPGMAPLPANVV